MDTYTAYRCPLCGMRYDSEDAYRSHSTRCNEEVVKRAEGAVGRWVARNGYCESWIGRVVGTSPGGFVRIAGVCFHEVAGTPVPGSGRTRCHVGEIELLAGREAAMERWEDLVDDWRRDTWDRGMRAIARCLEGPEPKEGSD